MEANDLGPPGVQPLQAPGKKRRYPRSGTGASALTLAYRKFKGYFTLPRNVHVYSVVLDGLDLYGLCCPSGAGYVVLVHSGLDRQTMERVLLHELAHVEAMHLHACYTHAAPWRRVVQRIKKETGIDAR